jgi:hypothetical protein
MLIKTYLTVAMMFIALPLWTQVESSGAQPAATGTIDMDDRMVTPTPVGVDGYSLDFDSEASRSNYLRGGVTFKSGYDDNIVPASNRGISDFTYSVWPTITLDQSRPRIRWELTYSPGFTFYQRHSSRNGADHNLGIDLDYLLSPHVTLSVRDSFEKTSNSLNLFTGSSGNSTSGLAGGPNDSIVPPLAEVIRNSGEVELTYQFGPNAMVGTKGASWGLWYPNRSEVPGLLDSTAQAAEVFYTQRLSKVNYVGATYQFQNLLSHPSPVTTQTHSVLFFYTAFLRPRLSLSLFAGPEYAHTHGGILLPLYSWSPAGGASLGWQGMYTSFVASYSHRTNEGGGLGVAVRSSTAEVSARWQMVKTVALGLGANYGNNTVLEPSLGETRGHTISGNFSVERSLGENLRMQLGYTWLHQNYINVAAFSNVPDRNYAWVSLSYQFQRPLGR